jgi:predicted dehydrogenase
MIRIGIIGAGANTRRKHLPNLQAINGVEVLAVCNKHEESTQGVAEDFDIPRTCRQWQEVIDMEDLDAVVIGTWPYLHCPATCAAFRAGKHVLVEARMAMNADEARKMLRMRNETGLVGQVVPSPVGLGVHDVVKDLLNEGFIGRPREVYLRSLSERYIDPDAPIHWRLDREFSGLNTLSLGIFNETLQRWLGYTTAVMAKARTFIEKRPDPETREKREVEVPDSLSVLAEMACGARAVYHMSGVTHAAGEPRIEIYGGAGTLHYLIGSDRLMGASVTQDELEEIEVPAEKEHEWTVERDFIDAIREDRPIEFTRFEDGVRYMEFTEAVHRSDDQKRRVALSEIT